MLLELLWSSGKSSIVVCLCRNYKIRSLANILTTEEDRVTKQLLTARVTMVSVSSLSLRASRDFMFCLLFFYLRRETVLLFLVSYLKLIILFKQKYT